MGFFDALGEIAGKAANAARETKASIEKEKEHLQYKSDEELKRILQTGSFKRKMAAGALLKERGYSYK